MIIPEIPVSFTAQEKLKVLWDHVLKGDLGDGDDIRVPEEQSGNREWPSYNDVLQDVRKSDYNELLTCPLDLHPGKPMKTKSKMEFKFPQSLSPQQPQATTDSSVTHLRKKTICAQGVVCTAKLELFDFPENGMKGRPYSGLLKPGTTVEHCLVRLSSALQPMEMGNNKRVARMMFGEKLTSAKIFPGVAIKMFRSQQNSGNALFLGSKVGQPEDEFFAHCLCTQITSRMPVTLKPILHIFKRYSQNPMALGLSDLCMYDADGQMADDLNFPFCLTLHPRVRTKIALGRDLGDEDTSETETLDSYLDDIQQIPKGTTLYDVFASPDPLSVSNVGKLQRIGRIVSTSAMEESPQDDGLFFRHQKKDEDIALRPEWKDDLSTKVVLKDGSKGTAATLAGWELFEHQIADGGFIDFEHANK
jgi:hypothetical protein